MSIYVPLNIAETDNQGNLLPAKLSIGLQPGDPNCTSLSGAKFIWVLASTDVPAGTEHTDGGGVAKLAVANDNRSAVFTPLTTGSIQVSVRDFTEDNQDQDWKPNHLYRVGDRIVDSNSPAHVQQVVAASKLRVTRYTPEEGKIPSFAANTNTGEAGYAFGERARKIAGDFSDPQGYAHILNQGDGDLNGDWPLGAMLPLGSNTNGQVAFGDQTAPTQPGSLDVVAPGDNTGAATEALYDAASVIFEVVGFSGSGASGIESPTSESFDAKSGLAVAEYTEIGTALGEFDIASVATGTGAYTYAATQAASGANAFAGKVFRVKGFVAHPENNGDFICTASSTSVLTLANAVSVSETIAASATNSGEKAYLDQAGNVHIGWQTAEGTLVASTPSGIPPAFRTDASNDLVDNDLVWEDMGTLDAAVTDQGDFGALDLIVSANAKAPAGNFLLLPNLNC